MITIGGYRIYWPVFVVIFLLIAAIAVFIVVHNKKKKNQKSQAELKIITTWQKKFLYQLFSSYEDGATDAERKAISNLKGYLNHHYVWNADEVAALGEKTLEFLDYLLFVQIQKFVNINDKNQAVLCLHLFDMVNGGPEFIGNTMDWIQDDIDEQKNDLRMDVYEARLFELVSSAIEEVSRYVDPELEKIPEEAEDFDSVLKTYTKYDFSVALQDSMSCNDFKNLSPETYDIAARAFVREIQKCIVSFTGDRFPQFRLYYIRALACCLDKEPYDEILDTIELE